MCASHMAPGLDWRLWHAWEEDLIMGKSGEGGGRIELDRTEEEGA